MSDLRDILSRVGVSRGSLFAPPNITYAQPGRTNPQTVPLIPGLPGLILAPEDRPLSPEEESHEGTHAALGLPGAVAGVLGGKLLGVDATGAYLAPDEVLAYLSQPDTADSATDRRTINTLAGTLEDLGRGNSTYLNLVKRFTKDAAHKMVADGSP